MQANPNTTQNSPQREITLHPSGIETSGFPIYQPNARQIESAARRALGKEPQSPRYRIYPARFILIGILFFCLVYLATYFVLSKVLG